jgi:hypothetical protein
MNLNYNIDMFRQKHEANDLSVFTDFEERFMETRDMEFVQECWREFPNAAWTRASGHFVEDMINKKMYDALELFWKHDMFRMGGKYIASHFIKLDENDEIIIQKDADNENDT